MEECKLFLVYKVNPNLPASFSYIACNGSGSTRQITPGNSVQQCAYSITGFTNASASLTGSCGPV